MRAEPATTVPVLGAPYSVRFDGRLRWSWWGEDADGRDRAAARGARLLTWDDEAACLQHARSAGWEPDEDSQGDRSALLLDLDPAQRWLARRAVRLDPTSGLELWNWALDAAASTGRSWNPRGRLVDACYRKLFAANVPYFFDLESYRPQWSARQLRVVARVLGSAVHVVRAGYGDG